MSNKRPESLYRVQHSNSFTTWDARHGFQTRETYLKDNCSWINKEKFEKHLDWSDCSPESTPFISVFDNYKDALKRMQFLVEKGRKDVFIAEIQPSTLQPMNLTIHFSNEVVQLPVWQTKGDEYTFIPTSSIRKHLGVAVPISQLSEWFAIEEIPRSMITNIYKLT